MLMQLILSDNPYLSVAFYIIARDKLYLLWRFDLTKPLDSDTTQTWSFKLNLVKGR